MDLREGDATSNTLQRNHKWRIRKLGELADGFHVLRAKRNGKSQSPCNWCFQRNSRAQLISPIRMTNAQLCMNSAIKKRWIDEKPQPIQLKMRRFTENVSPRTSTKRGAEPFYSARKNSHSPVNSF